jgi:hypothetical protein
MNKPKKIEFRINYTRPGVEFNTTIGGLTFEFAVDELTARWQFAQRFPTATIETIEEVKP